MSTCKGGGCFATCDKICVVTKPVFTPDQLTQNKQNPNLVNKLLSGAEQLFHTASEYKKPRRYLKNNPSVSPLP